MHRPQPRDYSYRFPRRKLRGALRSALSAKFGENGLAVVEAFNLESHKTKDFLKIVRALAGEGKILLVNSGENRNLRLSSRNLPDVKVVPGTAVNINDIVNHRTIVFSKEAILQVQEGLSR